MVTDNIKHKLLKDNKKKQFAEKNYFFPFCIEEQKYCVKRPTSELAAYQHLLSPSIISTTRTAKVQAFYYRYLIGHAPLGVVPHHGAAELRRTKTLDWACLLLLITLSNHCFRLANMHRYFNLSGFKEKIALLSSAARIKVRSNRQK